jgi:hypothetical protein
MQGKSAKSNDGIFCERSGQNNVQESARTAWFGIYRCIERMAIKPVYQTLGTRIANRAQTLRLIMAIPALEGKATRTYECAYGHRERIIAALP